MENMQTALMTPTFEGRIEDISRRHYTIFPNNPKRNKIYRWVSGPDEKNKYTYTIQDKTPFIKQLVDLFDNFRERGESLSKDQKYILETFLKQAEDKKGKSFFSRSKIDRVVAAFREKIASR